jgi:hypothetical protein
MDARLEIDEPQYRRPEHIERLLKRDMSAAEVDKLRRLDIKDRELLAALYDAGEALASAQLIHRSTTDDKNPLLAPALAPDWPPVAFDPADWRSEGAAA